MEYQAVDEVLRLSARLDEVVNGVVWTHKIHEKQADIYEFAGKILSLISTITVAMSGSGAVASIVVDGYVLKCVILWSVMRLKTEFALPARESMSPLSTVNQSRPFVLGSMTMAANSGDL